MGDALPLGRGVYAKIVNSGYSYKAGAESNVAFFPLLPILTALVRAVTHVHLELGGFLVSNAVLLRRLASLDHAAPSRLPEPAVWPLLFCPMTFFHSAMYTESLFLLLSLSVLYYARQRCWLGAWGGRRFPHRNAR